MPPGTTSAVATDHSGTHMHGVASAGGVGPDTLVSEAGGMPAEFTVLVPGQPKAAVESHCDLHATHPAPPFALSGHTGFPVWMPELNRRNAMLMAGLGAIAATMPIADAQPLRPTGTSRWIEYPCPRHRRPVGTSSRTSSTARPARRPTRRSGSRRTSASRWRTRRSGSYPGTSEYRDDRRNLRRRQVQSRSARRQGRQHLLQRQAVREIRGRHGHTWEARIKLNCLTPGVGLPGTWPTTARSTAAKSTSWSGTATATGPREPPSTPS